MTIGLPGVSQEPGRKIHHKGEFIMKRFLIVLALLLVPMWFASAESITLDSTETLVTPAAESISDWEIIKINAANQELRVRYRWRASDSSLIKLDSTGWNYWTCRNRSEGNNDDCTDVDVPWDCCTGEGTGTCPEAIDTCFSDVFNFQIRAQDVDTSIGVGLRTLIWNQMKADILTGANDGSFD